MTSIVSWISNERKFPTLWTIADSRLSNLSNEFSDGVKPILDCAAKIFSIRVVCEKQGDDGRSLNDIYYSTTIGMSYAGSSLLGLNLYAFVSYTLGNLLNANCIKPSMKQISDHLITAFNSLLSNYIDTKMESIPVEISIFGYCPILNKHQLFHIKHSGRNREVSHNEFEFVDISSIHVMGSNKDFIYKKIISDRNAIHEDQGTNARFWRSPLSTLESIIGKKIYPDIGGKVQLGICYPLGFKLTPIFVPDLTFKYFNKKGKSHLVYQGIDLFSSTSLLNVGDCSIELDSIASQRYS
jgi:hypothetical protein